VGGFDMTFAEACDTKKPFIFVNIYGDTRAGWSAGDSELFSESYGLNFPDLKPCNIATGEYVKSLYEDAIVLDWFEDSPEVEGSSECKCAPVMLRKNWGCTKKQIGVCSV
jgi:hypothetical protein